MVISLIFLSRGISDKPDSGSHSSEGSSFLRLSENALPRSSPKSRRIRASSCSADSAGFRSMATD